MSRSKSWTYEQITEHTRERISTFMELAAQKAGGEEEWIFRRWAYGAYLLWDNLTVCHQADGDNDRLLSLTEKQP